MRRKCLPATVAVTFAALVCAVPSQASGLTRPERALLGALNQARGARHLTPLRVDWRLGRAARTHSRDMLQRDYFAHGDFLRRLHHYGAAGPAFGENLAWGVGTGAAPWTLVRRWLNSPGHRRNLLRPGFRRVGVGAPSGEFQGYANARVVTVDFAGS